MDQGNSIGSPIAEKVTPAPDERPTNSQWLAAVYQSVDELFVKTAMNRYHSKAELLRSLDIKPDDVRLMDQIASRFQWIASGIDASEPSKFKVISK